MKKLLAFAVVCGGVGIYAKGCLSSDAPDEQLAARFGDLCKIARDHANAPNDGVTALGDYLGDHFGDMQKNFGDTIALIERISDDTQHDARAELARTRWIKPNAACAQDWMDFADAVEGDPVASERIERFNVRLNRTLDIIFGEGAGTHALRDLPLMFERFGPWGARTRGPGPALGERYLMRTFQPAPSVPSPVPPAGAS